MRVNDPRRTERGWHDGYFCIVLVKKVTTFLKNTQFPDDATRVTPQAFILKKDRSRSWRRKLRASEVLNGVFWATPWYPGVEGFGTCNCCKYRVIHSEMFLGAWEVYLIQLGWMSPKKLAVWCDWCSLWDSEYCIFTTSVGRIYHCRPDSCFFTSDTDSESLPRLFFNIVFSACKLYVVQGMNHCMAQLQLMVPNLAR